MSEKHFVFLKTSYTLENIYLYRFTCSRYSLLQTRDTGTGYYRYSVHSRYRKKAPPRKELLPNIGCRVIRKPPTSNKRGQEETSCSALPLFLLRLLASSAFVS